MKFKTFLLLTIFCFSGCLFAHDSKRDEMMWAETYKGEFSIVHKLAITREIEDINDELLNQFVMAYVYYKMDKFEDIEPIFKGIDRYIDHVLMPKEK
jgi:hypothetical protein